MTLKELKIGKTARVLRVGGEGALRQHFLDMGIIPGTEVTVVQYAPMGDPMELRLHGYELTLRLDDAAQIDVAEAAPAESAPATAGTYRIPGRPATGGRRKYRTPASAKKASSIRRGAGTRCRKTLC